MQTEGKMPNITDDKDSVTTVDGGTLVMTPKDDPPVLRGSIPIAVLRHIR